MTKHIIKLNKFITDSEIDAVYNYYDITNIDKIQDRVVRNEYPLVDQVIIYNKINQLGVVFYGEYNEKIEFNMTFWGNNIMPHEIQSVNEINTSLKNKMIWYFHEPQSVDQIKSTYTFTSTFTSKKITEIKLSTKSAYTIDFIYYDNILTNILILTKGKKIGRDLDLDLDLDIKSISFINEILGISNYTIEDIHCQYHYVDEIHTIYNKILNFKNPDDMIKIGEIIYKHIYDSILILPNPRKDVVNINQLNKQTLVHNNLEHIITQKAYIKLPTIIV